MNNVHNLKNLRPQDYRLVGFRVGKITNDDRGEILEEYLSYIEEVNSVASIGGVPLLSKLPHPLADGNYRQKGTCDHCGAHFLYEAVYQHLPTSEHIVVGLVCASHAFALTDHEYTGQYMSSQIKAAKTRAANKNAKKTWHDAHPEFAWTLEEGAHHVAKNIVGSITAERPDLTEKQYALLEKLAPSNIPGWVGDITPSGKRSLVRGVVCGVKTYEGFYGTTKKFMVVAADKKVWVTAPTNVYSATYGDGISFVATLSHSEEDESFLKAARPTKSKFLFYRA